MIGRYLLLMASFDVVMFAMASSIKLADGEKRWHSEAKSTMTCQ